ncbi:hypothetical protein [Polaromonas sp.]|uniref:hypothetical protein n=1 Tax=Polaromonas sp. TaxID=1869339 RepID=UPI003C962F73
MRPFLQNSKENTPPALMGRAHAAIFFEPVQKLKPTAVAGWIAALVPPRLRRATARPWVRIVLRLIAALPGAYAFTAALVALLAAALPLLGLARSEAVVSAAMLGFVLYLLVLLWAFSVRSLVRLWAALAGGTALAFCLFQLIR